MKAVLIPAERKNHSRSTVADSPGLWFVKGGTGGRGARAFVTFVSSGPDATIGSASRADIRVADRFVSRVHARLTWRSGVPLLVDLGSTNGTWLGGRRLLRQTALDAPALISLGARPCMVLPAVVTPWGPGARLGDLVTLDWTRMKAFVRGVWALSHRGEVTLLGRHGSGRAMLAREMQRVARRVLRNRTSPGGLVFIREGPGSLAKKGAEVRSGAAGSPEVEVGAWSSWDRAALFWQHLQFQGKKLDPCFASALPRLLPPLAPPAVSRLAETAGAFADTTCVGIVPLHRALERERVSEVSGASWKRLRFEP